MSELPLIVTLDVECDKTPTWRTAAPLAFRGVTEVVPGILTPLFARWGIRPTYLVSPEVLTHGPSVEVLAAAPDAELGTHLHHEYVAPRVPTWDFGGTLASGMQRELPEWLEREKLQTLTALFRHAFDASPRSFRAGRFGAGPASAGILGALGYTVESSVTPHVQWTTASGAKVPDYRRAPELPYQIAVGSDVTVPGAGPVLEVPVTILPSTTPGGDARWFRPWSSDAAQLERIVNEVAAQAPESGMRRPLVMMFHSCELVAGASPYPQTVSDVQRFIGQIEHALDCALRAGAVPMTLSEYAVRRTTAAPTVRPAITVARVEPAGAVVSDAPLRRLDAVAPFGPDDAIPIPQDVIEAAVTAAQAQTWFAYSARERKDRWELWEACRWMVANLPRDARILSSGCGIGVNLLALHAKGFTQLEGFDIDERAVNVGQRLSREIGATGMHLYTDDGVQPLHPVAGAYDAIEALNWVMLVPGLELGAFCRTYAALLRPGGYLFLDVIDASYDALPGSEWHSADRNLPEHARRPSEYKLRPSLSDVRTAAAEAGLEIVGVFAHPQTVPKRVYLLQRFAPSIAAPAARVAQSDNRPRVKIIADVPNWIFERHARALQRLLSKDLRIDVGFATEPTREDEYDLVYPLEWSLVNLAAIRRPSKWVTGIRSHVSWERFRPDAMGAVLREKFARVHVVSRRLQDIFAPFVPNLDLFAHGVDTRYFTPSAASDRRLETLRVGWAGNRKTLTKNFDALIAPLGTIPGIELAFCGYADRNLGINEMREWYETLDVVVYASGTEGHNNTILEAAAMARAIVTTDAGTVPEWLVHGESALIVPGDAASLAAGVIALRDDPTARGMLGRAARAQVVARWDWHARAEDYRHFFTAALGSSAAASSSKHDVAA